ncbi:O-antigen/teichoic acid export membrane protein [Luteibacter sp. Sphag1AF]|uniref:oligosaccharide flippase family protein n=1 Tax=Luteibacter sp. Sphag1AF TaxID=2587031 RepID=UPI0016116A15|nr:oligosaccharide flippase family protein [Luteibacter sp. Sphag1AF]MBB3228571.1 O-antigen/teichoic acid export membrane protein [Luteibacter sp. Sphag1AF]
MNRRLAALRSVTIVSVATYIEYALGLLMSVWIARALGPADFGRYAFTVWLCGWLLVCSNHALTTSSMKFIAEAEGAGRPDIASHISHRLSRAQHLSSLVVISLFLIVVMFWQPSEWHDFLFPATLLVVIAVAAKANYAMLVAIAKGQEHFETEAIATVVAGVIGVGLIVAAAFAHVGLLGFVALFAVACLMLNVINRMAYRHYCKPFSAGPVPDDISERLRRHLRLTALIVLLGSFKASTIEVFLLNAFSTSTAVGFFAIAATLTRGAVQMFSVGLTSTLLPYMARSYGERGHEHATRLLAEATRFYWATGLAIAGIGVIATPDLVHLMYGNRYTDAIPAIEATLVLAGLLLIVNGITAFQTVVDRQGDRVRMAVISLAANAVLGIALIPAFGLTGAVLTYAGTRLCELALSIYYLRRATAWGLPLGPMLKLTVIALVATGLGWWVTDVIPGRYAFLVGSVLFTVIFLPASVVMRYWNDDDYRLIGAIAERLGAPGRWLMRGLAPWQGAS